MAIQKADGTVLSKTALLALTTEVPSTKVTIDEDIFETYNYAPYNGVQPQISNRFMNFESERRKLFAEGQIVDTTDIDDLFPTATIISVSPATGAAAGGTVVVVTGTNLSGASGVTFGGTAGTSFSVLSQNSVRVTTPAKTAGAYNVIVVDDSGSTAPLVNGFTYT